MNMNFETKLKTALQVDGESLNTNAFIDRMHSVQLESAIKRARIQTSLATALFLIGFSWLTMGQLNNQLLMDQYTEYYSYSDYDYLYEDHDSTDYEIYVADLALQMLEEDDLWDVLEFFEEVEYNDAFNSEEIKL